MSDTWDLAVQLAAVTAVATAIGVVVYLRANLEPWPLTARIGVGLAGASIGTFTGGLLLLASSLQGWTAGLLVLLLSTAASVQKSALREISAQKAVRSFCAAEADGAATRAPTPTVAAVSAASTSILSLFIVPLLFI